MHKCVCGKIVLDHKIVVTRFSDISIYNRVYRYRMGKTRSINSKRKFVFRDGWLSQERKIQYNFRVIKKVFFSQPNTLKYLHT